MRIELKLIFDTGDARELSASQVDALIRYLGARMVGYHKDSPEFIKEGATVTLSPT